MTYKTGRFAHLKVPPARRLEELGLRRSQALGYLVMWQKQKRSLLYWLPSAVGTVIFLAWMFAFGRITDRLEDTPYDILERPDGGRFDFIFWMIWPLALGYGGAFAAAMLGYHITNRILLTREIDRRLANRECFNCGYQLHQGPAPQLCPECGEPVVEALRRN